MNLTTNTTAAALRGLTLPHCRITDALVIEGIEYALRKRGLPVISYCRYYGDSADPWHDLAVDLADFHTNGAEVSASFVKEFEAWLRESGSFVIISGHVFNCGAA